MKKLLAVFAHPDDEAFGPGGTLAKYAKEGVEIHLLCATKGERGQWEENSKFKIQNSKINQKLEIHNVREKELLKSAEILGVKRVDFLDFIDGHLCNANYHDLAKKIIAKIKSFKPQVVMTLDRLGVSGHLDHIAVSMITTYSYLKTRDAYKLYYFCLSKQQRRLEGDDYFVYFPEGYSEDQITTRINYSEFFKIKSSAMYQHQSQLVDVKAILSYLIKIPKIDNFILQYHRKVSVKFPETDLFTGI